MRRRMTFRRAVCALAAVVALAGVVPAYAETQGMDRRDDRRDDRDAGRDAKQACKAGDENTRAECRQEKRDTKHGGWRARPLQRLLRHPRRPRRSDGAGEGGVRSDGALADPISAL